MLTIGKSRTKTMRNDIPFSARCVRCGSASIAEPERLDFEEEIACDACGHSGTVAELADVATLDAMLKEMTAGARLVH
jgi:hypothetical protein